MRNVKIKLNALNLSNMRLNGDDLKTLGELI